MASPSVTYTFSNSTTADATQVNQNFTDLINGVSDGTKDLSISALTCAGNVTLNGNTTIGNASSDTLTVTAALASTVNIGTTFSYDLGSTTIGLRDVFFGSADSAARTTKIRAGTVATSNTLTLPIVDGTVLIDTNIATQAEQETGTSTSKIVTSGRQHFHQSAAKAWARWDTANGSNIGSYNVSSITNTAAGDNTINFTTSLSSGSYSFAGIGGLNSTSMRALCQNATGAASGSCRLQTVSADGVLATDGRAAVVFFGDI